MASRRATRSANASIVKSASGRARRVQAISSTRRTSLAPLISSAASSSTVSTRARRSAGCSPKAAASAASASACSEPPSNSSARAPATQATYTSRTCATRSRVSSSRSFPSSTCARISPYSSATSRSAMARENSPRIWSETSPKSERASSACTAPLPKTLSCSSVDNASRMPPFAWRATMASASSS